MTRGNDHAPPADRFQLAQQSASSGVNKSNPARNAVSIQVPIPSSNTASTLPSAIAFSRLSSPGRDTHCKAAAPRFEIAESEAVQCEDLIGEQARRVRGILARRETQWIAALFNFSE